MRMAYTPPKRSEEMIALAERLVKVLLDSGASYRQADDALTLAQEMLMDTKPISR